MNAFKSTIKWIAAIVVICLAAYFLASINGLSVSRTIGTIGGNEVTESEFKYYLEMTKDQMISEAGATDEKAFWESEIDGKKATEVAKERALEELVRTEKAVVKAAEEGITLSEEEKNAARSVVSANNAEMAEQIKELEDAIGADKYAIADIMEKAYLANAYYQHVTTMENSPIVVEDAEVNAKAEEAYACVKHVLVMNAPSSDPVVAEDGTEVPAAEPTEEELAAYKEEAKKKADDVLAKAVAGENFEGLITEYGEDPGMTSTPDGYLIDENGASIDGSGTMVEEFTKGTFAVKAGEVNPELVESSYGWHIIKRYPLPAEGENHDTIMASAKNNVTSEKYEAYIDGLEMEVSINEKIYNKIKVN